MRFLLFDFGWSFVCCPPCLSLSLSPVPPGGVRLLPLHGAPFDPLCGMQGRPWQYP